MSVNQAFVFIKPHVVNNEKLCQFIRDTFDRQRIRIMSEGDITSEQISAHGMVDKHYAVNAVVGTIEKPSALPLAPESFENFGRIFGVSWQDTCSAGKVFSATAMQARLGGISGEDLIKLWNEAGYTKVGGGFYVAYLKAYDCYVLNGFYPSLREVFTRPGGHIRQMTVQFESTSLAWSDFRSKVIGATNPAEAQSESIRGYAARNADLFDVATSSRDNILHGSASPFEALVEQSIWLQSFEMPSDPLGQALAAMGYSMEEIRRLRDENPIIPVTGQPVKLVDLCEDCDTPAVVAIFAALNATTAAS